jgi:hypothetical protein
MKKTLKNASITCAQAAALWGTGWLLALGISGLMSWLQL